MKSLIMVLCALAVWMSPIAPYEDSAGFSGSSGPDSSESESSMPDDLPALSFASPAVDPEAEEITVDCPFSKEADWYLIDSASGLRQLQRLIDQRAKFPDGTLAKEGRYRLTQPINLSQESDPQRGWIPIGSFLASEQRTSRQWASFSGEFDGGGHAITGLKIRNRDLGTPHGLFGYTTDAVIRNVVILDCDIESTMVVGAVAGQNTTSGKRETMLTDCCATGKVTGFSSVGGVLGLGERVVNCGFEGEVTGLYNSWSESNSYGCGGVAATADSIDSCFARGKVSGYETVGGVISNCLRVKNCYFIGEVRGVRMVGGISGSSAVVQGCYSAADVYGFEAAGGIAGHVATTYNVEPEPIDGLVSNVLAVGNSIHQIEKPAEMDSDFDWPVGRIIGFVGAGIGTDQMYALETMRMEFAAKRPQNAFEWDGDHFPENGLQDPTAWREILTLEGRQWADVWAWQEGAYPRLAWE